MWYMQAFFIFERTKKMKDHIDFIGFRNRFNDWCELKERFFEKEEETKELHEKLRNVVKNTTIFCGGGSSKELLSIYERSIHINEGSITVDDAIKLYHVLHCLFGESIGVYGEYQNTINELNEKCNEYEKQKILLFFP